MADVTKEIALKVKATDASGPALQSLEDKLNAAKKRMVELAAAGKQNTEEFRQLQAEAGNYKRIIEGVEQSVDSFSKGGSKALTLVVEASQAVGAGFAIAQGAAALFGDENEDLQKAMLKVQGAIALVNGVQQINVLLTQKSVITTEAAAVAQKIYAFAVGTSTGAMKTFRLALLATGIGAFVVVLGFAAEAMGLFGTSTKDTTKDLEAQKKALEDNKTAADAYTRLLKAQGMSEKDLNNRRIREIDVLLAKTVSAQKQLNASAKAGLDFLKFEGETYNQVTFKAFVDNLNAEKLELIKNNKAIDKEKTDKATQTANELTAIQKRYTDQLAILNADALNKELLAIDQKYEADLTRLKNAGRKTADLEAVIAKEKEAKRKEFADKEFDIIFAGLQREADAEKAYKDGQLAEFDKFFEEYFAAGQAQVEADKKFAEQKKAIDKSVAEARAENIRQVMVGVNALADFSKASSAAEVERADRAKEDEILALDRQLKDKLITQEFYEQQKAAITDKYDKEAEKYERKQFELNKAAGIANAMVNTYLAATQVLATTKGGTVARFVAMAATITAGLAQVAVISKQQFRGRTAGKMSATEAISGGGGSSTATPSPTFSNPNTTMLGTDGAALNANQANQPMRAYVVERDIQQTTSRVRRLSEFATLG
jgi:hypothetical protein